MATPIHRHDAIPSTQEPALAEARQYLADGVDLAPGSILAVHLARNQTQGRGQHGRCWRSPPGGLYFSAAIAAIPETLLPLLPPAMGLAIARAAAQAGLTTMAIRWPNDVLAGSRKIAGVLCQGVSQPPRSAVVVGVGLNVNNDPAAWGEPWNHLATSWRALTGREYDLEEVFRSVLKQWDAVSGELLANEAGRVTVFAEIARLDALVGKIVTLRGGGGRTFTGRAAGLTPTGSLRVQTAEGEHRFTAATIESVEGEGIRPPEL